MLYKKVDTFNSQKRSRIERKGRCKRWGRGNMRRSTRYGGEAGPGDWSREGCERTWGPGGYTVRIAEGSAGGTAGRESWQPYARHGDESGGGAGGAAQEGAGTGKSQPAAEGREQVFGGDQRFFCREPSEVSKEQRMRFIAKKTDGSEKKGKLSLYCRVLEVSREGFYRYLARKERPWKY